MHFERDYLGMNLKLQAQHRGVVRAKFGEGMERDVVMAIFEKTECCCLSVFVFLYSAGFPTALLEEGDGGHWE